MPVLVDSDVLIEVSRGRNPDITGQWKALSRSETAVVYSPVTAVELWAGSRPAEYTELNDLFQALTCIPIDAETGRKAGEYLRQFHKSHSVELGDALIGAAAAVTRAQLWTRNRKHYPMKDVVFFE